MVTKFLDVSYYQGDIDFEEIREETDIKGIIHRASIRLSKDTKFDTNWPQIVSNGFIRGTYHYFYNIEDAVKQANTYYGVIRNDPGDIIVVDVEDSTYLPSDIGNRVYRFLGRLEELIPGRKFTIYTRKSYWTPYVGNDKRFRKCNLWVAQYNDTVPSVPLPWFPGEQILWQFSSKGTDYYTQSLNVDLDVSNLSEYELRYKTPA